MIESKQNQTIDKSANPIFILSLLPVLLAGIFFLFEFMVRVYPSVFKTEIQNYYHFSDASEFGLFASSYYYLYTPLQLFTGILADRIKFKYLLMLSVGGCSLGLSCLLFQVDAMAYLGRMLIGASSAAGFVLIFKSAALYAPRKYFTFFCGMGVCLGYIGALITAPTMQFLASMNLDWGQINIFFMAIGLSILIIIFLSFKIFKFTPISELIHKKCYRRWVKSSHISP